MVVYFITGTSSGLGKATAEAALKGGQVVVGISRRHTIAHSHYYPVELDLSDAEKTGSFSFDLPVNAEDLEKIVLVNNAGVIEPVKHVGHADNEALQHNLQVNLVAPILLMNQFFKQFDSYQQEKVILNVSSGAGDRPMDGWAAYCSSKAGLNMASKVVNEENQMNNRNCRVYALAPGIVDTPMQDTIREASENEFSRLEDFQSFKEEGLLIEPKTVAKQFINVVNNSRLTFNVIDRLN